jgi:hypothetical protein
MIKKGVNRSGQISIFIIIAVIIVVVIAIIFIVRGNNFGKEKVPAQVLPVYSFVSDCIKDTGENAVYYIGQTGGYFESPNLSTDFGIAYYFDKGKNFMPAKENIEKEIENYTNYMLGFCTGDFSNLSDYKVIPEKIKTDAKIEEGKVVFNVEYPLSISKGTATYTLKNFDDIEIPVRLNEVYDLAANITREQMVDLNNICITCIYDAAKDKDMYVEMNDLPDNESIVFTIRDDKSTVVGGDYRFNFANRYEFK